MPHESSWMGNFFHGILRCRLADLDMTPATKVSLTIKVVTLRSMPVFTSDQTRLHYSMQKESDRRGVTSRVHARYPLHFCSILRKCYHLTAVVSRMVILPVRKSAHSIAQRINWQNFR